MVKKIANAARECIPSRYKASDICRISVHEVQIIFSASSFSSAEKLQPNTPYTEAHHETASINNVDPDKLRTSTRPLLNTFGFWEIDSQSLIVVFGGNSHSKLRLVLTPSQRSSSGSRMHSSSAIMRSPKRY